MRITCNHQSDQSGKADGNPAEAKTAPKRRTTCHVGLLVDQHPHDVLSQLEPILRRAGITAEDVLELFESYLKQRGLTVFYHDTGPEIAECYGHYGVLTITDDEQLTPDSTPPHLSGQTPYRTEIILRADGSFVQGFRLDRDSSEGCSFFVPDFLNRLYQHFGGDVLDCVWDEQDGVWRQTGEARPAALCLSEHPDEDEISDPINGAVRENHAPPVQSDQKRSSVREQLEFTGLLREAALPGKLRLINGPQHHRKPLAASLDFGGGPNER